MKGCGLLPAADSYSLRIVPVISQDWEVRRERSLVTMRTYTDNLLKQCASRHVQVPDHVPRETEVRPVIC